MKFKEIIRNKWGWVGAVGYTILNLIAFTSGLGSNPPSWAKIVIYPSQVVVDSIGGLQSGGATAIQFIGIAILPPAVLGFITGLILQKVWRKLK